MDPEAGTMLLEKGREKIDEGCKRGQHEPFRALLHLQGVTQMGLRDGARAAVVLHVHARRMNTCGMMSVRVPVRRRRIRTVLAGRLMIMRSGMLMRGGSCDAAAGRGGMLGRPKIRHAAGVRHQREHPAEDEQHGQKGGQPAI